MAETKCPDVLEMIGLYHQLTPQNRLKCNPVTRARALRWRKNAEAAIKGSI